MRVLFDNVSIAATDGSGNAGCSSVIRRASFVANSLRTNKSMYNICVTGATP